jgi:hypothetical protein
MLRWLGVRVRGGLGVTVVEEGGRICVKGFARESWETLNQVSSSPNGAFFFFGGVETRHGLESYIGGSRTPQSATLKEGLGPDTTCFGGTGGLRRLG